MKAITILKEILLFIILVLFQVLLFNRIIIFGYATPILYIYFLIKLPVSRNRFYVIISGFLLGFVTDIFLNTPGMNAAATTLIAAFRALILSMFYPREESENTTPNIYQSSLSFVKYVMVMVLVHQLFLFFIESFTLLNLGATLMRICTSSLLTIILICALDLFGFKNNRISG